MRNQPKYNFFKNTMYALNGLLDIIKNESSFKIELVLVIILIPFIFILDLSLFKQLFMFISLFLLLLCEIINSAIERCVDLVTLEYNEMAKRAKDVGSTIVFFSILILIFTWGLIIFDTYFK